jgi:hypothetical protein
MKQFSSQQKLRFEIATGTQAVTPNGALGSAVGFKWTKDGFLKEKLN